MQKFNVSERTADTRINALYALLDAHEIKIGRKPFVRYGKRPDEEAADFDSDDDTEAQERRAPKPKPKPEDILALIPERGSKLKWAIISEAGRLDPPIGKDKAQGLIAELLSDGQAFHWSVPVAVGRSEIHLSRRPQENAQFMEPPKVAEKFTGKASRFYDAPNIQNALKRRVERTLAEVLAGFCVFAGLT